MTVDIRTANLTNRNQTPYHLCRLARWRTSGYKRYVNLCVFGAWFKIQLIYISRGRHVYRAREESRFIALEACIYREML